MGSRPEVACSQCSFCPGPRSSRCSIRRRSWRRSPRGSWRCRRARSTRRRARRSPPTAGSVLTMAGRRAGGPVAVKLVGVFPGNVELGPRSAPRRHLPVRRDDGPLPGADGRRGDHGDCAPRPAPPCPRARWRATDARVLAVVGVGRPGARAPADAAARARRSPTCGSSRAIRTAAERLGVAPGTVEGADVICLTHLVLRRPSCRADVAPGTHVTSVGFAPPGGELDPALAASARLFVETRQAFAPPPAGCAELAGLDPSLGTELGEVLLGRAPGRVARRRDHRLQGDGAHRRGRRGGRARVPGRSRGRRGSRRRDLTRPR